MTRRWRVRESLVWHAVLGLVFLIVLAPSPPTPARIPQSAAGPEITSGLPSVLWQADFGRPGTLFLHDTLILTHGKQIEARNAISGRRLWAFSTSDLQNYQPRRQLEVSGDHVVAVGRSTEGDEKDPSGSSLLVFNGRTGAVLWNLASGAYGSGMPKPYFTYLGIGMQRVFIHVPAMGLVRALDTASGRRRWDAAVPSGCITGSGDADEWVVALLLTCGDRLRLLALEPSSGRLLWDKAVFLPSDDDGGVMVSSGAISLHNSDSITIYDVDGQVIYEHVAERTCARSCMFASTASGLLVVRWEGLIGYHAQVADMVDRRRRQVTHTDKAGDFEQIQEVDGRIYGTRRLGGDLHASILVEIDPVAEKQRPLVKVPLKEHLANISRYALLSINDDGLLTAFKTIAPRSGDPGMAVRGDVDRAKWPDVCTLIPQSALKAEFRATRYRPVGRPAPPELALETPISCDLVPDDASYPVVTISIIWVSDTSEEAKTVLASAFSGLQVEVADRRSDVEIYVSRYLDDALIMRVGSLVLRMDNAGNRSTSVRLATRAAHVLGATV